jgi:hypothetical protein
LRFSKQALRPLNFKRKQSTATPKAHPHRVKYDQQKRAKEISMEPTAERARLITEVLTFVGVAQCLPGISRIALIGSLTTQKADPKDADLLLTVTDNTELASLARLSRRLQGHAQNMNRGAEVFLADPNNNYLGSI